MSVQAVVSNYIDFKKDTEKFTKYVEEQNVRRKNKRNNKNEPIKK